MNDEEDSKNEKREERNLFEGVRVTSLTKRHPNGVLGCTWVRRGDLSRRHEEGCPFRERCEESSEDPEFLQRSLFDGFRRDAMSPQEGSVHLRSRVRFFGIFGRWRSRFTRRWLEVTFWREKKRGWFHSAFRNCTDRESFCGLRLRRFDLQRGRRGVNICSVSWRRMDKFVPQGD